MADQQTPEAPRMERIPHAPRSGTSLGKVFIVVFVAALVGSYGGVTLSGLPLTGQAVKDPGTVVPSPTPTPSAPAPTPTLKLSDYTDNDPVLGDPNAPVTIIEFSDLQCPFCGRFYSQTLPQLKENYIKTGKAKLIYRDFPLSFHPEAEPAALATECANEQGKFWEFHDKIFENQASLSAASYKQWAAELGLNTASFNSCVDSKKYLSEVQDDFNDGSQAGVAGTPSFLIGRSDGTGSLVVGAQPYEVFKGAIDGARVA